MIVGYQLNLKNKGVRLERMDTDSKIEFLKQKYQISINLVNEVMKGFLLKNNGPG